MEEFDGVKAILGDKKYNVVFVEKLPKDACGWCDSPTKKGKKIQIKADQPEKGLLDTVLHEALHGVNYHWSEHHVAKVAEQLTQLLWSLGYRRDPNVKFKVHEANLSDETPCEETHK